MEFKVDKAKAVEALVYVAGRLGDVSRFNAAKILYFADLDHLNTFGRPITGDYYVAMENGPVPSFIYDVLKGTLAPDDKALVADALLPVQGAQHPRVRATRDANLELFSRSDLRSLDSAIQHVGTRSFGAISDETHKHEAWKRAPLNGKMAFDDMMTEADASIVGDASESAQYAVL